MASATIKIFLVHGDPKRLRTAEISNWTGNAVARPRTEFDAILLRDESASSGIYFLTGNDPDTGKLAVYVGEAESIRDRVRSHLDKDFWNHIVFFTSKDENLTKSHIRYLEGRLIEQIKAASRAVIKNSQGSGSRLPESDREDMEIFLEKVHQLLPALGVEVLVPLFSHPEVKSEQELLLCEFMVFVRLDTSHQTESSCLLGQKPSWTNVHPLSSIHRFLMGAGASLKKARRQRVAIAASSCEMPSSPARAQQRQ